MSNTNPHEIDLNAELFARKATLAGFEYVEMRRANEHEWVLSVAKLSPLTNPNAPRARIETTTTPEGVKSIRARLSGTTYGDLKALNEWLTQPVSGEESSDTWEPRATENGFMESNWAAMSAAWKNGWDMVHTIDRNPHEDDQMSVPSSVIFIPGQAHPDLDSLVYGVSASPDDTYMTAPIIAADMSADWTTMRDATPEERSRLFSPICCDTPKH